jgi:hypothetical protein
MLHLAYWWLYILLHRPFYRRSRSSPQSELSIDHVDVRPFPLYQDRELTNYDQHCNKAADNIMELLGTWRSLYTLRYVPILWIQIVYSAGTIFLLSAAQAGSGSQSAIQSRNHSLAQAELCVQYLYQAGKSWQTARHVKQILEKLLKQLTARIETRPQDAAKNVKRKSTSNTQSSSQSTERPDGPPSTVVPDTSTSAIPDSFSPFPTSPLQIHQTPMQPPSSLEHAFGNGYNSGQFVPALNGDSGFGIAGQFGLPNNPSFTPQNFLSFGHPALSGFDDRAFQQDHDPPQHFRSESLEQGMDALEFWPQGGFYPNF